MTMWTWWRERSGLRAACTKSMGLLLLAAACGCTPSVQGSVSPQRFSTLRRVVLLPFATPEGAPRTFSESFADEMSSHLAGARFAVVDRTTVVRAPTYGEIRGG